MRSFVVFALIVYFNLAACDKWALLTKEEAIAIITGCKDEAGASDAEFEAMFKHLSLKTKEGKCMRACVFKKIGMMNDDGKIIKDVAIKMSKSIIEDDIKKELAVGIHDSCDGLESGDDRCEVAEEYALCIKSQFDSEDLPY